MEHVVECQYVDLQRFLVQASTQRSAGMQDVSLRRLHALCLQQGAGVERGAAQGGSELPDLVQELVGASSRLESGELLARGDLFAVPPTGHEGSLQRLQAVLRR